MADLSPNLLKQPKGPSRLGNARLSQLFSQFR